MFVYVIRAAAGPLKIGISQDPYSRLAQLQTGHFCRLKVCYMMETDKAAAIEACAHKLLAYCRVSGEWFNASLSTAMCVLDEAEELVRSGRDADLVAEHPPGTCTTERVLSEERANNRAFARLFGTWVQDIEYDLPPRQPAA